MNKLLPPDLAADRYTQLVDALGAEPEEAFSKTVLARLVSWSTGDDIGQLGYLIRRSQGRYCQRCLSLLEEVAEVLATAVEAEPGPMNFGVVEFPIGLAHRVLASANEGTGQ